MFKKIVLLGCADKELKSEEDQKSSMADAANKKTSEKSEDSNDAPPIPPVRKNKLAKRSKSLLDEITEVLETRAKTVTMETDTTESDFSDFDHSLFKRRNLSSPPLRPNPDSAIPKTDIDSYYTNSPLISVTNHNPDQSNVQTPSHSLRPSSLHSARQSPSHSARQSPSHSTRQSSSHSSSWSPAHSQYSGKSPRSPARKQRQYIVNPDDSDTITRVTTTYYQNSRPNSADSYVTQNAYLTTDSSSYDSTTTDTESEIASPVRNSVYGLRYRKIHNDDTDNKSDEDILSDAESLEQLMLHRLPGENLGMILGVEAGKKGSSKVRKVIVKSVTLGGAAYRATGGMQGLRVGDEIVEVNRKVLSTLTHDECVSVFHEMPLRILLSVRRKNDPRRGSGQHSGLHQKLGPVHSWPSYNGYQSETSESEAEGGYPRGFQTHEIKIRKNSKENLGISIVPSYGSTREYYQIKRLLPSGVCARDPQLNIGDRLVSCNGQSLKGVTQNECLNILKSAGNDLKLTVLSSDNLAYLGMDSNTESEAESVNNNVYKNGLHSEPIQHSEHGLSASKTNANVLFAQKNVKLAYTPPYIANQIPSDSESSVASTPSKETQSVISEVDQHILDLTGLGMSQFNGMEPSETNFTSADNSLLESIPPPMEFSDNPISPEESETSTLTDPGDSSLPFTNLDDLLGNDSTATNTPIHTTSTPIHNVSSTISQSFPENDDLLTLTSSSEELTIVSTSENVVHSDASDRLSGTIPYTDLDNIQNVSDQNSPKSSNNILEFDTKVSNVIEGGQSTTLFDIGVKSVNDARHVSQTSNIDDLLFLDQTNNQQSSSNSSVEINKVVVSQEQNVSPQVNVLNTEQTNEKTSNSLDNVTTVQVGLISLNPNDVVDEGLVTKVPIIDLEDTKQDSQLENQVTQVAVNEKPRVTKVDVGYDKSNASFRNENDVKIPGATVFCVDNDIKDSNTARITVDNPSPPVPTPRLSPQVVPRKHRPKSEIIDLSEKQAVPSSPTPLPRKTHAHNAERNAEQSPFHVLHEAPSLNTAKLVEAAKPSATIVVSNSDPDLLKSGSNIEKEVMNSVETITELKPTLIHDSVKDQGDASVSKLDMAPQKPQMSTITVKTPRQKSSKEARSDRSGKVMVTTCQTSDVRLSRPVEEEESIQPMSYVQDELGNRSCVPTPPTTPKRQQKTKDEGAKKEITDILMNLVNLESVSDNAVEHESTVIEEGKIEPEKVSRQTMETVLGAFSSLIPGLDKPHKKSIFQKAVSEVIDDMDDDNNNVPKEESKKTEISNKDEAEKSKCKKKEDFSEKSKSMNEMPSVLQTGFASIANAIQSKSKVSNTQNDISTENNTNEKIAPHAVKSADSTRGNISEDVTEKPKDIEIVSKNQETQEEKQKEQKTQGITQKSERIVPKPSLISAAPKKIAPAPHITTIRTQPFSSLKSGLTSFSTNKVSKADYPKRRCDDQPFQVDVLKGIAGLGIKLAVGNDGLAKVTNIQTSGPVAKTGQVRVGDYVLSINSTVLRGVSDSKVQQILRLLPRGLSKLVISTTIPHAHSPDKTGPLSIDTDCTDNSMELSPTSPSTGFTKYGVRVSPKPFSSLSNSSSPKSLSDGLASIKESKYSPVTPPTRKVSVDKTSDSVNGSSNGSASVEYPFGKDEPTSNGAKSVPFPFDKFEPSVNSVNKISGNQNGLADELVIKTDSSVGSSPIVSPRSPAGMSPALSPRSDSGDSGIEKAQKPVKKPVHSSNVYVNKNQNNPAKKLGIDIPKSHAESKIIAATWGKDTDEVSVKNPPPVAPKPKSRTAKAPVPDPPKKQVETQISVETAIQPQQSNNVESQPPIPSSRQKSPGVETLNLNDKLKRFESEIQRQTDLAKPSGPPPVAARRTSSSSEHSTASLRSSSPDRDVFLSDDKKSNGPTMVYSTTVKSKGDLPKDQDKSYYMKIKNQENSLEITRTEVRKQSVEEQVPKRKTSSGSSPLSPNSPFYQDLTEKPAKINPVRLNRALAPKGSSQNQNVEINSTVKLTAPSHPPPEIKPKPKTASWFAGKESDTSTTKSECTSPTPSSVVSTEPHLIFESPKCKSPRNNGTKKSPSDSMTSPTSPRDLLVSPDATSFVPGVKLEYESPKSPLSPKQDMQRKFSEDEIQTKFDDLLNLDSVAEKTIVESTPEDKTLVVSVVHEEVTSEKIENVESAGLNVNNSALVDNTEEVKVDDVELKLDDSADDIQEDAVDNNDKLIESETPDSKQSTHLPTENIVEETPDSKQSTSLPAENVEDAHTIPVIPDSAVEPYAAALVEKVIDSAKECIMKSEGEKQSSTENSILEPVSEEKMDVVETTLIESSAPVEETLVPESVESVQIKPDILNDVQTNDVSKKEPEVVSESDSERSPSPPPLPSSPPPPLPSSPPPMTAVPPPTLLPSFEDPPDLVDFMTGSIVKPPTQFIDPQPDVVNSSPMVQEEDIRSEERKDVAAAPNLIGDIAPSVLPDVTNDSSAIDKNESSPSETGILDDSAGSSVDPVEDQLLAPQIDSLLNTACNSQHDNVTSESNPQQVNVVEQTNTTLVDTEPDSTIPNQVNSTDLNVVKDTKNDLLDSNENLFSAKPVVISSDEPDVPNSSSSIQVSSFQESLPITNQDNSYNKIYSSTPAKGLATPSLVATDIDIDSSFKSDTSNETLLDDTDNSEYVNISMTSNGPDVTNEALKVSGSSISKRDWTFVTSDKDTSVIEGKANVSFEFLDFTNVSLIEPEELKRLVDQANQTMDRTGVSSSDQIIVVLLHRKEPTDKVGLELMKGSQGKVIISGLTPTSLARTDGKIKVTDCLVSVNGKPVDDKSIGELQDLIETPCSTVVLVLSRGENSPKTPASPKPKEREVRKSSPITPTTPTSPTFTNLDFTCGETMEVTMIKGATGVGFCLAGGIGSPQGDMPIIIKRIFKGGPADKCGQLQVKDQILQVNDLDFTTMRHYEAWNHLKYLPDGEVKLVIRRGKEE